MAILIISFGYPSVSEKYIIRKVKEFVSDDPGVFEIPELDDDSCIRYDIIKQARKHNFKEFTGCYLSMGKTILKPYVTGHNTGP